MTSWGVALVLQVALGAGSGESYAEAHRASAETGRPLVIMVGAEWCPACMVMKNSIMPQVKQGSVFGQVAFAAVDLDQERELGSQLTENGPIPQLIMYTPKDGAWEKRRLIGGQDTQTVETFLREGISASKADAAKKSTGPVASQPKTNSRAG